MERLERTINTSVIMATASFLLMLAAVVSIVAVFSKETIHFDSFEIQRNKKKLSSLEKTLDQQHNKLEELQSMLITFSDINRLDTTLTKNDLLEASKSDEDAKNLTLLISGGANQLDEKIDSYNENNKDDQFYDKNFNAIGFTFFRMSPKHLSTKQTDGYNEALKETISSAKRLYLHLNQPINLKKIAEALNEKINSKIKHITQKNSEIAQEIEKINQTVAAEEQRLENVSVRTTSILISKSITVVMAIVVLLTLLSVFRYSINSYNRAYTQLIIIEQSEKGKDIEILRLITASNTSFDNKAEDLLVKPIGKNSV